MTRRRHQQEFLANDRYGHQRLVVDRQGEKAQIGAPRPKFAKQARRAAGDHLDVDVRMMPPELFQERREHI